MHRYQGSNLKCRVQFRFEGLVDSEPFNADMQKEIILFISKCNSKSIHPIVFTTFLLNVTKVVILKKNQTYLVIKILS